MNSPMMGFTGSPPVLEIKTGRTHCEVCGDKLYPDKFHKCDFRWHARLRRTLQRWKFYVVGRLK